MPPKCQTRVGSATYMCHRKSKEVSLWRRLCAILWKWAMVRLPACLPPSVRVGAGGGRTVARLVL